MLDIAQRLERLYEQHDIIEIKEQQDGEVWRAKLFFGDAKTDPTIDYSDAEEPEKMTICRLKDGINGSDNSLSATWIKECAIEL